MRIFNNRSLIKLLYIHCKCLEIHLGRRKGEREELEEEEERKTLPLILPSGDNTTNILVAF